MKKRIITIALAVVFAAFGVSTSFADNIADYKQELKQNQQQIGQVQQQLDKTTNQKATAKEEVEKLDKELNKVNTEYERLTKELADTNAQLEAATKELEEAKAKREVQYETLKERIKVMYEEGDIGYLEVLLNANDFSDYLNRMEYINRIMDYDNNLLADFQALEQLINDKVVEIDKCKQQLETLASEQAAKKSELDGKVAEKLDLISKLSKDEASYNQQLSDLEEDNAQIEALIQKAEKEAAAAKAAAQAASANAAAASYSSSNKIYSYGGGRFLWPVPAYVGSINDVYGYRSSPISGKGEFHSGLDMKAPYGTDIVAADNGTVIYAAPRNGYGNCVIIDHGGGFSTLYGHNSSLCVTAGQSVVRGQVIAKAGATGYATGPHCHFEVRIDGKYVNPNPYL